jgi:SOS-response transcriptional repressor LexA
MGSNVLLTSENPNYELIMLTRQVSVLGVAVVD